MANRTKVPCHCRTCPELVDPKDRYCPTHIHMRKKYLTKADKSNWKPPKDYIERAKLYKTKQWSNLRKYILSRNARCRLCGDVATQVDHITPVKDGGSFYAVNNLQALCARCHSSKTRTELNTKGNKINVQ